MVSGQATHSWIRTRWYAILFPKTRLCFLDFPGVKRADRWQARTHDESSFDNPKYTTKICLEESWVLTNIHPWAKMLDYLKKAEAHMDSKDLLARIKEDGVKFISLQFTDVTGSVKSVDIPAERISAAMEDGIWFDGSSVEGFARIQESDMRLVLDPSTYTVLPWTPQEGRRGRVFCDIYNTDGDPFPGDPRGC